MLLSGPLWMDICQRRHRDDSAEGCPLSALGTELRRSGEQIAEVTTEGMKQMIELIASSSRRVFRLNRQEAATAVLSAMVGGMLLARLANNARRRVPSCAM